MPYRVVIGEVDVLERRVALVVERAADVGQTRLERQVRDRNRRVGFDVHDSCRVIAADDDLAVFAKNGQLAIDEELLACIGAFSKVDVSEDVKRTLRRIKRDGRTFEMFRKGNFFVHRPRLFRNAVLNLKNRTVFEDDSGFNARVAGRKRPNREAREVKGSAVDIIDDRSILEDERAVGIFGVLDVGKFNVGDVEGLAVLENHVFAADIEHVVGVARAFLFVKLGTVDVMDILIRLKIKACLRAVGIGDRAGREVGDATVRISEVSAVYLVMVVDLNAVEEEFVAFLEVVRNAVLVDDVDNLGQPAVGNGEDLTVFGREGRSVFDEEGRNVIVRGGVGDRFAQRRLVVG